MRDRWRPKPPPPAGRAGALAFVFVLLLCAILTALLFLLNPLAPAARLGNLFGAPDATPTLTSTAIPARASPLPATSVRPWQVFLPFIQN